MRPFLPPPRLPFTTNKMLCPALPAGPPTYVLPASNLLDPPYSWQTSTFPFPRFPWPFETESRAPGTGLIASFINQPCSPLTQRPSWWPSQ